MTAPFRILFVCTANICRSPFLELYARSRLGSPAVAFSSAGTHGFVDHPISDEMGAEARMNWGLEADRFRSRLLTADLLDEADLVLTAEQRHRQYILDDHPDAFRKVLTLGQAARRGAPRPVPERRHRRPLPSRRAGPGNSGRSRWLPCWTPCRCPTCSS